MVQYQIGGLILYIGMIQALRCSTIGYIKQVWRCNTLECDASFELQYRELCNWLSEIQYTWGMTQVLRCSSVDCETGFEMQYNRCDTVRCDMDFKMQYNWGV